MEDTYVTILHYTRDPNGILSAITKVIGPAENMISAECKIRNLKWLAIFPILHEFDWPCVQSDAQG